METNSVNQLENLMDECLASHWVSNFEHVKEIWLVQYMSKDWDAHSQKLMEYH